MDAFRFAPELFEVRTNVMERLTEEGFNCILQRDDAVEIQKLLMVMFPAWMPG